MTGTRARPLFPWIVTIVAVLAAVFTTVLLLTNTPNPSTITAQAMADAVTARDDGQFDTLFCRHQAPMAVSQVLPNAKQLTVVTADSTTATLAANSSRQRLLLSIRPRGVRPCVDSLTSCFAPTDNDASAYRSRNPVTFACERR